MVWMGSIGHKLSTCLYDSSIGVVRNARRGTNISLPILFIYKNLSFIGEYGTPEMVHGNIYVVRYGIHIHLVIPMILTPWMVMGLFVFAVSRRPMLRNCPLAVS